MLAPVKSEPIVRPERSANCKLFEGIPPLCVVKDASVPVLWCSHFICLGRIESRRYLSGDPYADDSL